MVACLVAGRISGLLAARWEGLGLVGDEAPSYRVFRFPVEIISHGVWLYYRFRLRFREVQEMRQRRGVVVSPETIRQWCVKFGQTGTVNLVACPAQVPHVHRRPEARQIDIPYPH